MKVTCKAMKSCPLHLAVAVAAMLVLSGCEHNCITTKSAMPPRDPLMPNIPKIKFEEPDIVLEVQETRYLLDGKAVRKSHLHDALTGAASQGKKVLEIRVSDSVSLKRVLYVLNAPDGTGLKVVQMKHKSGTVHKTY